MIQFLQHNTSVALELASPDLTVLEYLREHKRKCGTKEGCASGDCGACTVVIASPVISSPVSSSGQSNQSAGLSYRAVNACITFMGVLHARQLITVEDLEHNGELHPVQQAMYELHASQCGFCTPGLVMSLFALYKNVASEELSKPVDGNWVPIIEACLGGNLCRCTGYRPIVDAGLQALEWLEKSAQQHGGYSPTDQFDRCAKHTRTALLDMADNHADRGHSIDIGVDSAAGSVVKEQFYLPKTLDELDQLTSNHPDARLLAGGTDLALEVTQQLREIDKVICLDRVTALQVISLTDSALTIGAGVTLSRCMQELGQWFPELRQLLHRFGSTQIRNQGTLGGNLANASPIGDLPPVLLALDAQVHLRSAQGQREMPLADFFTAYRVTALQPGEYIASLTLQNPVGFSAAHDSPSKLKIYKISKRIDDDISTVCAVFNIQVADNTIELIKTGFGGMAAVPKPAMALQDVLSGQRISSELLAAAQQALQSDFEPISDARASAAYRSRVAANLLERLFLELSTDTPTQVFDYV